jgi:putative SOS response-associated peptidase YedK
MLVPYAGNELQAFPVSTHVNRPANDDPACVEPSK